jgi:hypothetical protein
MKGNIYLQSHPTLTIQPPLARSDAALLHCHRPLVGAPAARALLGLAAPYRYRRRLNRCVRRSASESPRSLVSRFLASRHTTRTPGVALRRSVTALSQLLLTGSPRSFIHRGDRGRTIEPGGRELLPMLWSKS